MKEVKSGWSQLSDEVGKHFCEPRHCFFLSIESVGYVCTYHSRCPSKPTDLRDGNTTGEARER